MAEMETIMNLANKITLVRIFMIPLFMVALMLQTVTTGYTVVCDIVATVIFVVAALTDGLDGHIARKYNQITDFGKFVDPLADKLLVATALISLVELGRIPAWMPVIIIAREFIVTSLRIVAMGSGVVLAANMTGKIKTVIQIIAIICALLLYNDKFAIFGLSIGYIAMLISTLFTIYSGVVYLKDNWKLINTFK